MYSFEDIPPVGGLHVTEMPERFLRGDTTESWQGEMRILDSTFNGDGIYWRDDDKTDSSGLMEYTQIVSRFLDETLDIRLLRYEEIRHCLALPEDKRRQAVKEADYRDLLKLLYFQDSINLFPNLQAKVCAKDFLHICLMSVSSLKFITVEQTGQRVPISTGRSKGLVHYYCLKWLIRYLNAALAGDLLSTLLGMSRSNE